MDVARLITVCTTPETRYKYEKECLEFYYNTFKELMMKIGKNINFTFEQVFLVFKK